ncbi:NAD(P)-binding protein [Amniculicola lignicola CBS 123094]|uniref:NAD(P)-binding protein n=1 Tax=Amniculicola lignicola CBS 123094 TaxID=1392246 RepID=A0A6A5WRE6_9PLEO|nr:NAD(P)-binding protein [Amniculicola lignicola CBS 123094]
MTSSNRQILLLGAGELGRSFLPSITTLPAFHTTLAVRSPHNYTALQSPPLTLLQLDTSSPSSSLIPIFAQYDIIISCTGFGQALGSLTKTTREVFEAGKVRRAEGKERLWFFPWQWGVDYDVTRDVGGLMPLFGEQYSIRQLLRSEAEDAGVKWTIVSTGIFMSFLFEPFWGIVGFEKPDANAEITVRALRDWDHKITVTAVEDIGRVVARILAGDVDAENLVLYVAGDTVSYGELANVIEKQSGKKVKREAWTAEHLRSELDSDPGDGLKKYRVAFAGDGVWWDTKTTVNAKLGMEMVDVRAHSKDMFTEAK